MEQPSPRPGSETVEGTATRLASLAVDLREHQLGGDNASFGGVFVPGSPLCADGQPSFVLTCGAVWAWGAALRSGGSRPHEAAASEAQLCDVARSSAWQFLLSQRARLRGEGGGGLGPLRASALLLACASERLLADSDEEVAEQTAAAAAAADELEEALGRPGVSAGPPPSSWLLLPLLLYAHAAGRADMQAGARLAVLRATSFPELPLGWWDDAPPPPASARLLCPWAGSVVAAIVACQGEQELVPWCARVAAASLPERVRGEAPLCEQAWAHNASLLMALQALTRALPRGWTPLRRAERAAAGLAAEVLRRLDAEGGEATLVARLVVAFALYGFSVEPGGGRVCC